MRTLVSQWSHPVILRYFYVDPHTKTPFFDYVPVLCLNLMIWEILLLIATLGIFGLCFLICTLTLTERVVAVHGPKCTMNNLYFCLDADSMAALPK